MRRPLILDVDTGNDDAVAIIMAATHPSVELLGCTTVAGNLSLQEATDNTLRILDAIDRRDVQVHAGLAQPFAPRPYPVDADGAKLSFHHARLPVGTSGLQPRSWRGVEWLVETLRRTTQPVTLVPLAPLTNIAAAITVAPDIIDSIAEVVLMGGSSTTGNRTPAAEFNMYTDAIAANVILKSTLERITMIALDATHEVLLSRDDLQRYRGFRTRAGDAIVPILDHYIDGYAAAEPAFRATSSAPPHDALCIAYAIDQSVLDLRPAHVEVDTVNQETYGRTTVEFLAGENPSANVQFARHADAGCFNQILEDCLRKGRPHADSAEARKGSR